MRHFKDSEFACKCCGANGMQAETLAKLDRARGIAQVPFAITSGFRCPEHNKAVGSTPTSSHLFGHAVDISAPDSPSRFAILGGLILAGFRRIGIGPDFIHVDDDPDKPSGVVWTYYK